MALQRELNMSSPEIESLARELLSAHQAGQMVPTPLSSRPGFDLDKAYQVEATLKQWHEAAGHKTAGLKVGYANKAMWRVLKLGTLVWAHMYGDTVHQAKDNSATLSLSHTRSLKIEPEIVFGLKQPITSETVDANSALEATDWLALGFEIIDCPFPEWRFQPSDFVASFGLQGISSDRLAGIVRGSLGLFFRLPAGTEVTDEGIERRSEHQTEDGDADHPGEHGGSDGLAHLGSGPCGDRERKDAEDEGRRGHQDRTKTDARGFRRRLLGRIAVMVLPLPGELHDQDRVLRGQAH